MSRDKRDWKLVVVIATTLLQTTPSDAEKINSVNKTDDKLKPSHFSLVLFADTGAVLRNKAQSELPRGSAGFRQGLTEP